MTAGARGDIYENWNSGCWQRRWRIGVRMGAQRLKALKTLAPLGPLRYLFGAGSVVAEGQAREVCRERIGAIHQHLTFEVAGGPDSVLRSGPWRRQHRSHRC